MNRAKPAKKLSEPHEPWREITPNTPKVSNATGGGTCHTKRSHFHFAEVPTADSTSHRPITTGGRRTTHARHRIGPNNSTHPDTGPTCTVSWEKKDR